MKNGITMEEDAILNVLSDAHNLFIKLPETHPFEKYEWIDAIHRLQSIIGYRALRRDYPEKFTTNKDCNA